MLARTSSVPRNNERLALRRRRIRRRFAVALLILSVMVGGAMLWGLQQKEVLISDIQVFGTNLPLAEHAYAAMEGRYLGIIPRASTFFVPDSRIRRAILETHSDIAAVSIFRNGLTGLSIKAEPRVAVARWCGLVPSAEVEEYCYVFDGNGYVFGPATIVTDTLNIARLYAPLEGDGLEPLRGTIAATEHLPSVFDFARQIGTLGTRVDAVIIRGDEVDDLLVSGTRLTYVLGHEQEAFTALVSAKESLNLADGSIEYIDLRFEGKMYVKRKDASVPE